MDLPLPRKHPREASGLSSTDVLRVAVVGAGLMGRWHAHYALQRGAKVAAVVDTSPEAASALARRAGGPPVFLNAAAMLEAVRPDVAHICSPLASHLPLALQAIAAGAHVLVEKPMTPTAAEAGTLLDAARARGVHACPVHQF